VKILAVLGSPRRGGNTEVLLDRLLAGATDAGAEVEKAWLGDLSIHPMCDWTACKEAGGPCTAPDDAFKLMERMAGADVILLATPLYWFGPSSQLKTFIDRWACLSDAEHERLHGKKGFLVHVRAGSNPASAEPLVAMIGWSFRYLKIDFVGEVSGIAYRRGEMAGDQLALETAGAWGRRLARGDIPGY